MTDIFTTWVNFVLQQEGGLTDDPHDPGGLTNFGIDKRSHPNLDIRALTRDQAIEIYRRESWIGTKADQMPPAIAIVYADTAVNQGAGTAAALLQQSLGCKVDGSVGPVTLTAAAKSDARAAAAEFTARRVLRYAGTPGMERYGLGWMRRAVAALNLATGMA